MEEERKEALSIDSHVTLSLSLLGVAKEKETTKSYGKPKIGAPFTLTNASTGQATSSDDFKGRYYMVYFGFTHCPDICPEELDKMAEVVDNISKWLV